MSGHSKWSTIKRQKGVADARRGQLFTKLGKEIAVAVREGGPDPASNVRLRLAVQRAKDNNMPNDNIDRAIKRASGAGDAANLMEVNYEGYGPNGTAIIVQVLTDNKNRTVADIRNVLSKAGGNMADAGAVAWLFESKGMITVEANADEPSAEELALTAIDAGADDVSIEDSTIEVYTDPANLESVRQNLGEQGASISSAELIMKPKTILPLDEKASIQTLRLLDKLEDLDDVQRVFTNADFPDDVLEKMES
jgi:YebC/PmpR family DNA-binding regulatory protein